MFYATMDHDSRKYERGAYIDKYRDIDEYSASVNRMYAGSPDSGAIGFHIVELNEPECWMALLRAPRVGDSLLQPFSYTQMRVDQPGTHPGGGSWWITPLEAVHGEVPWYEGYEVPDNAIKSVKF